MFFWARRENKCNQTHFQRKYIRSDYLDMTSFTVTCQKRKFWGDSQLAEARGVHTEMGRKQTYTRTQYTRHILENSDKTNHI